MGCKETGVSPGFGVCNEMNGGVPAWGGGVNSCFGSRDIKLETPVMFLSVWSSREGLAAGDGGALARCGYSEPQA